MSSEDMVEFEKEVLGVDLLPKVKFVDVDDLVVDGKNPNSMNDNQFKALVKNIEKFGFLVPIITNDKLLVADGEHRICAAKKLGMKKVPIIALPVHEVDRRILRQVMNKLRGEHDFLKDADEFKFLDDNKKLKEFADLMAVEKKYVQDVIRLKEVLPEEYLELREVREFDGESKSNGLRTIKLVLTEEQKDKIIKKLGRDGVEKGKAFVITNYFVVVE